MGEVFIAALLLEKDIILICASRGAAQLLLSVCETFTKRTGVICKDPNLTTSKTKAMWVVGTTKPNIIPSSLVLNGRNLPYVDSLLHLGHTLISNSKITK